jgi:hypothetical protein
MDMQQRPISVTIFGILNIGFGMLGIVVLLISVVLMSKTNMAENPIMKQMNATPQSAAWEKISTPLGGIAAVVLLVAGIGLLMLRNWARIVSIAHGIYSILACIVGCIVTLSGGGSGIMKTAAAMVSLVGLVYPVLLIIFMMKASVVAAFKPAPPVV